MPAQLPSPLPPAEDSPAPLSHSNLLPAPEAVPEPSLPSSPSSPEQSNTLLPLEYSSSSPPPPPASKGTDSALAESPTEAHTPQSPAPSSSEVISSTVNPRTAGSAYVIWSRKPRNPSRAAGVMISSRSLPPSNVVEGAADLRTPPASPRVARSAIASIPAPHERSASAKSSKHTSQVSTGSVGVSSSSATEVTTSSTTPVTPTVGSPASTKTSVTSAAPSPIQQTKPLESSSDGTKKLLQSDEPSVPSISEARPGGSQSVIADEPPAPAAPHPIPQPTVTAPKKSWASLLQSNDAASSSKSRLPTSAVIGFSIPAGAQSSSPASLSSKTGSSTVRPEVLNLLNAGPSGPSQPAKIRPRGLVNTGNMCFANAVLQVLVYCPPFWRLFTELGKAMPAAGTGHNSTLETPLVNAIIQFLGEFGSKEVNISKTSRSKGKEREEDFEDLDSFIPTNVYEVMKEKKRFASMVGGHQEDAEEFLGFFLDTLEEELSALSTSGQSKVADESSEQSHEWLEVGKRNRAANTRFTKVNESPITRIFGGKFRSTLSAPHQRDSIAVEDWRSLRLDIQREQVSTIKDALQYISHPHSVEISSATRPGVVLDATRTELIYSLPPILILHLKRFLYDTSVGDVVKIGKHVIFGPELEIGADLLAKRPAQPVKYQLFGALYHHGQSASGGHYTLDVLHPNRDLSDRPRQAWIRIDDELVSDIRAEDVFGGQERDDRCAYLLFYKRVGPAAQTKAYSQMAK
ncbi:hypothetical protein BC835DRAFT_1283037 [Cytidiella melzeri]|nr:hypothetical protein BC835DRAFT_1283037 [Cytidiella melzeri]